jgi:hypothetical protein
MIGWPRSFEEQSSKIIGANANIDFFELVICQVECRCHFLETQIISLEKK